MLLLPGDERQQYPLEFKPLPLDGAVSEVMMQVVKSAAYTMTICKFYVSTGDFETGLDARGNSQSVYT